MEQRSRGHRGHWRIHFSFGIVWEFGGLISRRDGTPAGNYRLFTELGRATGKWAHGYGYGNGATSRAWICVWSFWRRLFVFFHLYLIFPGLGKLTFVFLVTSQVFISTFAFCLLLSYLHLRWLIRQHYSLTP